MKDSCDNNIFENDVLYFSLPQRVIFFKNNEVHVPLTVLQSRFIFFLLSGITRKNDLVKNIWQEKHITITDNNYHQLIHQCRAIFREHGIPPEVIRTLPRYGVMFDITAIPQPFSSNLEPSKLDPPNIARKEQLFIWSLLTLSSFLTLLMIAGN